MFKVGDRVIFNNKVCIITRKTINSQYKDAERTKISETKEYTVESEIDRCHYKAKENELKKAAKYHIVITEDGKEIINKDINAKEIGYVDKTAAILYDSLDVEDSFVFCK